jgi:GAF domain-containing protein
LAEHIWYGDQSTVDPYGALTRAVCSAPNVRVARRIVANRAADFFGTPWVGLTRFGPPSGISFVAASDNVVTRAGRIAVELKEGLSWQSYTGSGRIVVVDDLTRDDRWPNYRRMITSELPVRSGLAVRLSVDEQPGGALVAFADRPGYFDERRLTDATRLADHAALCLAHVEVRDKARNLELALRTSQEIGMAIGIIMERLKEPEDRAFEVLRTVSQARQVKIRDLAARVVMTGELPQLPAGA